MSEKSKNETNEELTDEQIEDVAHSVPKPDDYPPGQAEELEDRLEEVEDDDEIEGFEEGVVEMIEESEDATDSPVVETFDSAVTAIEESIESAGGPPETPEEALHHEHHGDVTVFRGKTYDIPLYTSVFLGLGVLTIIEVLVAEIITADIITIPVNLTIALAKVFLVVYFYMHLNTDSKVFALTLAVPVIIALLSAIFLFAIPTGGY